MTWFGKLVQRISGRRPTGAFYFSDFEIRYLILEGESLKPEAEFVLRLPKGIIVEGTVQNKTVLSQAVRQLVEKAKLQKGLRAVVVSLDLTSLYSQIISFPTMPDDLREAITLNIKGTSPLPLEQSYLSYQELGVNPQTGEVEVLITLVPKENIDAYTSILSENKFLAIAMEPSPFSIFRYLKTTGHLNFQGTNLCIYSSFSALHLLVIENLQLKTIFHIKESLEGKTLPEIQESVGEEIQRFLDFYFSKHQRQIDNFILLSQFFSAEMRAYLEQKVGKTVISPAMLAKLSDQQIFIYGAAIRGVFSPESDEELNILPFPPKKEFAFVLSLDFIEIWSIIYGVAALIVALTLTGVYFYINSFKTDVKNQLENAQNPAIEQQTRAYSNQLAELNKNLKLAEGLVLNEPRWGVFLNDIRSTAEKEHVKINNLTVSSGGNGRLNAAAKDRNAVISFKNLLSSVVGIANVDLPLQAIQEFSGGVQFSVQFSFNPALVGTPPSN